MYFIYRLLLFSVGCMSRENFDRKRTNSERIISSNAEQKSTLSFL